MSPYLLVPSARGATADSSRPPSPISVEVTGSAWLGSVDGHLQTPTGGELGTTSSHRPTTDEIGLDGLEWMPVIDGRLRLFDRHEVHLSYFSVHRGGSDVLTSTLISQGRTFPAGAPVTSHLGLDVLRIGYRPHRWQLGFRCWSIVPEVGVGFGWFDYRLRSPLGTGRVHRSYNVGFPYLGFLLERPITDRLRLEVDFAGSGGINGASFIDTDLRFVHELTRGERWDMALVVGLKGTWFRRHDGQDDEQNDPNLRLGAFSDDPWGGLTLGVRLGF